MSTAHPTHQNRPVSRGIPEPRRLKSWLSGVMGADRHRLRREIIAIERLSSDAQSTEKTCRRIDRLRRRIEASKGRRQRRLDTVPSPSYDDRLPIVAKRQAIIDVVAANRVVIISGETGSGKTTQIPKFCLEAGRGIDGKIGCTQPRRIAAITVAQRIAEELGEPAGRSVGYKIRFTDRTAPDAHIKIMTDGVLLAEAQADRFLNEYDTLIIDEAHERSLNIDFVLGMLKTLVRRRRDLKLIITSATIDTEKFSRAFDDAPVIEVSGRMYPVDIRYASPETADTDGDEPTHVEMAVAEVDNLFRRRPGGGDVLVFMPTEADIRETCELMAARRWPNTLVLPLFARLTAGEQTRVFARTPERKVIVATNVAETSVTIPGIRYVVDTGLARISQYSPRSKTTSLPVVPISRSSADQRMGRCGRVRNGVCIRLFSEADYLSRPRFTPPEILRSNLADVILRMVSLKLGDVEDFPFIDPPWPKHVKDGVELLMALGAIVPATDRAGRRKSGRYRLTRHGALMARMPLDPRLSRMLLQARTEGYLSEMMIIAAALSIQEPRERPTDQQAQADAAHQSFQDPRSDFITLLNLWRRYHETLAAVKTARKIKRFCSEQFLSYRRMREWRDVHTQIRGVLAESGELESNSEDEPRLPPEFIDSDAYAAIHRSILSGFLSNIAVKKEKNIFRGARDKEVMIFPGSGLFNRAESWIVAAEMVETSRLFARMVANIDVSWIEPLAGDQCQSTYLNPHWERNRGEVVATEQVTLYGLIIVPGRRVSYGPVDPKAAAEIFIRSALVEGDLKQPLPFMRHNQKRIEEIRDAEDRLRRRNLLVSDEEIYQFYRKRLPDIHDIRSLKRLIKESGGDGFLRMTPDDLILCPPDPEELNQYPESISLGAHRFSCRYAFDPGAAHDGVSVRIPSTLAPSVPRESLDWIAPGLLREKITAMIRGLPKAYRKKLVPVNRTVDLLAERIPTPLERPLTTTLGQLIHRHFGIDIPAPAWPENDLPDHLRLRVVVTDASGRELRAGRNASVLSGNSAQAEITDHFEKEKQRWEKTGITRWDVGDLPESVTISGKNKQKWTAFPALVPSDSDASVALKLFADPLDAEARHKKGVAQLYRLELGADLKYLSKALRMADDAAAYFGGAKAVEAQVYDHLTRSLLEKNIRSTDAFHAHADSVRADLITKGTDFRRMVSRVLLAYGEARSTLYQLEIANRSNPKGLDFLADLRDGLGRLIPENFLELYDSERIGHLDRYIRAITIRAQKGIEDLDRDQKRVDALKPQLDRLQKLLTDLKPESSDEKRKAVEDFFWMIEEYKVSLFAQELKTPIKISEKRLNTLFSEVHVIT